MRIRQFELERHCAAYEFKVRYLLSASDCESLKLRELLALADPRTLSLWDALSLGYTESQGHPLLREQVAGLYQTIIPDDILVSVPEEAIFVAMNALLAPGDHVIVTFPAYQSLYEIATALGCAITRWALEPCGDAWHLDLDFLRDSITPRTRLIVINFPHNPTGYACLRRELDEIVETAGQHGIYIFSDEMYRLLEYDEAARLPSIVDLYDRGIALSGLSKAFGLPGLRIGWLATRDRVLLEACTIFKDYTTICSSAPSEILGIVALRARDTIIRRNVSIIRGNLAAAERFFAANNSLFYWMPPRAGPVAFPSLKATMPIADFCEDILSKQSVMVVPGNVFEYEGNHFRIGLGRTNLPEALEAVQEYISEGGLG